MEEDCIWVEEIFSSLTLDDISQSDTAICYYVSGYRPTARRIDNQRKCSSCKELLISRYSTTPKATESLPQEHPKLFEMANRGDLVEPSAFCFAATVLAMQYVNALSMNEQNMKRLLALNNPTVLLQLREQLHLVISLKLNVALITRTLSYVIIRTVIHCFAKNQ